MVAARPIVSVVTPSYNQGAFIERTILSVLRQDYPHVECIVLDSLSTDETAAVLEKNKNEISILVREKDKGQADAINKGLARCSGQIMAYLNADDCYASPTVISEAVEALQETKADMVYGRRYSIDPDGFFAHCYPHRSFDAELEKKINVIPQECTFWTRDIYERADGFVNEKYQFAMDYELWLRFLSHGARFEAIEKVFGLFRWQPNQKSLVIRNSVGLPEIAKLQEQYAGAVTHVADMQALFESFYFNVNQITNPKANRMASRAWDIQLQMLRQSLADTPIDHWVFQQLRALA
jgi:glycosyltransferase involved in cell wall biosynthesis